MNLNTNNKRLLIAALMAIVACIVVVLVVVLTKPEPSVINELGIEPPKAESFRAASPDMTEIVKLIESESYDEALSRAERALKASDMAIAELGDMGDIWDDEELQYENELERQNNCEIRWTYVYLLLQVDRKKDARRELKRYMKQPEYCAHFDEAETLMGRLK